MRDSLSILCEKFIENRDTMKSAFRWENDYIYPVCAAVFIDKRKTVSVEQMKRCGDMLKSQTGIFSNFRGNGKLAVITMLAASDDPEDKLEKSLRVYDILKQHFWSSEYLPMASMIIADMVDPEHYEEVAARAKHIYNLMKQAHRFLTSSEDSVFAVLLALSGLSDEQIVVETERCYELLKPEFFSGNAVQSLSHVLALGDGSAESKCSKTMELFNRLRARRYNYGTGDELATLGVLALLPVDLSVIVEDLIEVDTFLAGQKGYGLLGIGRKQRLMHAGLIVTSDHVGQSDNLVMGSAAIGGTISLIAAQQAAICAAVVACNMAAASANASN